MEPRTPTCDVQGRRTAWDTDRPTTGEVLQFCIQDIQGKRMLQRERVNTQNAAERSEKMRTEEKSLLALVTMTISIRRKWVEQ